MEIEYDPQLESNDKEYRKGLKKWEIVNNLLEEPPKIYNPQSFEQI